ncbi:MAG: hypothetical protein WCD12_05490 [Candidatus Binatus sp.]|jgi:hypothetical protein|uniref:hypothetical protein n=1 Tax=Candidatus Binatus sp. TaxID=2811406 RepID=UPI003C722F2B
MDDFLTNLKIRAADAQKRFLEAQRKLQIAQTEFQAAAQEHTNYQGVIMAENRKINGLAVPTPISVPQVRTVMVNPNARQVQFIPAHEPAPPSPAPETASAKSEINKTEMVRELLRQHSAGMTPDEVWRALRSQLDNHAYIYSVLKRLKERDEVRKSRGKYYFKHHPQAEEGDSPNGTVQ